MLLVLSPLAVGLSTFCMLLPACLAFRVAAARPAQLLTAKLRRLRLEAAFIEEFAGGSVAQPSCFLRWEVSVRFYYWRQTK